MLGPGIFASDFERERNIHTSGSNSDYQIGEAVCGSCEGYDEDCGM